METQKLVNLQRKNGMLLTVSQNVITLHENPIKVLTSSLESSICDYSDVYILVTGNTNVTGSDNNTKVAFKNYAPFKNVGEK